ncbi:MAG: sigma-70 family RNA polymerase sigma factor [Oscillospiraceae bacterium]|jgi:RNA polymerase sigma-70 factor (ECF subfamily)|nr:sigma-70 family RNA polymerase sigma factor [Oscillospiraceae bacterium]
MEDAAIIALYWSRSESAIEKTDEKYGGYCRTIAYNILENHEDTEECTNDTYFKVWNAIPPQRPSLFRAFLGKIARNTALKRYDSSHADKRGGGETAILLSELEECVPAPNNAETECESAELSRAVSDFLYQLDELSRNLFVRRYWYAEKLTNLCEAYGISASQGKSTLYRVRGKLKEYLEKEGFLL